MNLNRQFILATLVLSGVFTKEQLEKFLADKADEELTEGTSWEYLVFSVEEYKEKKGW